MSLNAPNYQTFVERLAETFEADTDLFPLETTGEALINNVIRNRPAIEQSAGDGAIIPYIIVFHSQQPNRFLEKVGRDERNIEGGSVYELEFYCVAISNAELTRDVAQQDMDKITAAMRNALSRNLRLTKSAQLPFEPWSLVP